jgi:hypothetical protein
VETRFAAADLAVHARSLGLHVHMDRVNSLRRLRYAATIGAHSADSTHLAYGPRRSLPGLLGRLERVNTDALHPPAPSVVPGSP